MSSEYESAVDWLFNQVPMFQNVGDSAYKPGLDGVLKLSEAFGNPHKSLKAIHVGGTNGKGSVSSLLASVLQENGFKVGLFTSPHLVDFRERIRINGKMIDEEAVVDFIYRFRDKSLNLSPSFFELTAVMAFEWFVKNKIDIAVVEVGLGGRLDSTNIINPLLSVITNISFDHTAQLGNTLDSIAKEKAGIIKNNVPVVIGNVEDDLRKVFINKGEDVAAPVIFAQDELKYNKCELENTHYIYSTAYGKIESPLTGDCQPENTNTVLTAISILGTISHDAVRKGFKNVIKNTGLLGRWTVLNENPHIICDTGHNQGGWKYLGPRLRSISKKKGTLHIIAGFVNDKDISSILEEMPKDAKYYWATPSVKRGRDSSEVEGLAISKNIYGQFFSSVAEAYKVALAETKPEDTVFIGGSTYIVADLIKYLSEKGEI